MTQIRGIPTLTIPDVDNGTANPVSPTEIMRKLVTACSVAVDSLRAIEDCIESGDTTNLYPVYNEQVNILYNLLKPSLRLLFDLRQTRSLLESADTMLNLSDGEDESSVRVTNQHIFS
jgi:hypothetical protein